MSTNNLDTIANFTPAFNSFFDYITKMKANSYNEGFPENCKEDFYYKVGKKNIKVMVKNQLTGVSQSVYCFVDIASGDILKAASLNAPAKHARGNVHKPETFNCAGPYGIAYLR